MTSWKNILRLSPENKSKAKGYSLDPADNPICFLPNFFFFTRDDEKKRNLSMAVKSF